MFCVLVTCEQHVTPTMEVVANFLLCTILYLGNFESFSERKYFICIHNYSL